MKNSIQKITLLAVFCFVMIPGALVSLHLDQISEVSAFMNFSVIFTMIIFALMTLETLRRMTANENIDFNQQKIDILHSSFILMDGNGEYIPPQDDVQSLEDVHFNYQVKEHSDNERPLN